MMTTQSEHAVMCPELEELAAMIDGKLSGAERDAMVEHLASCDTCYEVYTETLRIQEDLGPRAVPSAGEDDDPAELAPVVRHPRSFGWAWRTAAAMAAVVVIAVGLLWSFSPPPEITDMSMILPSPSELTEEDFVHRWFTPRGEPPSDLTDRDPRKRAFRLGVHAIDLETSLRMDDRDLASEQTRSIAALLSESFLTRHHVPTCEELRDKISADTPPGDLLKDSSGLMDPLIEGRDPLVDRFYLTFGKWTEKSRFAARTGAEHYFGEDEFGGFLRRLEKAKLGDRVSRKVKEVRDLVASRPIPREDLAKALGEIIRLEGVG